MIDVIGSIALLLENGEDPICDCVDIVLKPIVEFELLGHDWVG